MRPEREYAAYIFDCDGTLADSMPVHHKAWVHALNANGARFDFTYELMCSWGGKSMYQTVYDLNEMFDHELDAKKVVSDQSHFIKDSLREVKGHDHSVALAKEFSAQVPTAVASGGHREHVHITLEAIGVREIFDVIVTHEDVSNSKPSPELFLLAACKMNVKPEDCLVYEDSATGVQAAKSAGMDYILVE